MPALAVRFGYYILEINDYAQIESVLATLRVMQVQVLEMELLQPDLKEVFAKIMGSVDNLELL